MGVVFHGNYVTWFEIGRTEWIRAAGWNYRSIEESGLLLPVIDLRCKYVLPARYDDRVIICTRVTELSPLRMTFESQVRRVEEESVSQLSGDCYWNGNEELPGELLVQGGTSHVWVNEEWRPSRLDRSIPVLYKLLQSLMDGEATGGPETINS